jgi:hypothetical protein
METQAQLERLQTLLAEAAQLAGALPTTLLEERGGVQEASREDIKRLWYAFGLDHRGQVPAALRR